MLNSGERLCAVRKNRLCSRVSWSKIILPLPGIWMADLERPPEVDLTSLKEPLVLYASSLKSISSTVAYSRSLVLWLRSIEFAAWFTEPKV